MIKKLVLYLIPILIVISHLGRRLHFWYQVKKEVGEIENRIAQLEQENQSLIKKKKYYQTEEFIHREAREKLGMTKENELVLLIPTPPDLSILRPKGEKYQHLSPWEQWYQLFFK